MAGPAGPKPATAEVDPNDLVKEIVRESQVFVEPCTAGDSDAEFDDCQSEDDLDQQQWTAERIIKPENADNKVTGLTDEDEEWADCREATMDELVAKMQKLKAKEDEERSRPTRIWSAREIEVGRADANHYEVTGSFALTGRCDNNSNQ